jgi:hypothetical protein
MPNIPAAFGPMIDKYMAETGQTEDQPAAARPKPDRLAVPACVMLNERLVIVVPIQTVSEANGRDWKARSRRSGAAWKAVRSAAKLEMLAPYEAAVRAGKPVSATFVRLGGRTLDAMVNLPSSMKGVEDAIAYLIGVDDRSPLWRPSCEQETGGPVGVRIILTIDRGDRDDGC